MNNAELNSHYDSIYMLYLNTLDGICDNSFLWLSKLCSISHLVFGSITPSSCIYSRFYPYSNPSAWLPVEPRHKTVTSINLATPQGVYSLGFLTPNDCLKFASYITDFTTYIIAHSKSRLCELPSSIHLFMPTVG